MRVLDSQKMVLYVEGLADLLFYSEKKYCTLKVCHNHLEWLVRFVHNSPNLSSEILGNSFNHSIDKRLSTIG